MVALAQTAHEFLQAVLPALTPIASTAASRVAVAVAEDAWKWLKSKLTSPGATEALQNLEHANADVVAQQMVQLYIQQAAAQDQTFREELMSRLTALVPASTVTQNAVASGGSKVIQVSAGRDAKVEPGT